jgi:hypothetical protein
MEPDAPPHILKGPPTATRRSLAEYLAEVRDAPFEWGAHDCVLFVKGAVEAQTGHVYLTPDYEGLRGALVLARRLRIVAELDRLFTRCPHVPPPGSIVAVTDPDNPAIGYRLGIVVSHKAAFVSPSGLVFARLQPATDLYWTVT